MTGNQDEVNITTAETSKANTSAAVRTQWGFWKAMSLAATIAGLAFFSLLFLLPSVSVWLGFALIGALVGVFFDWQYKRAVGEPTSKRDIKVFSATVGALAGFVAVLALVGFDHGALGRASVDLIILLFAGWEVRRWMMRQEHPLKGKL